MKGSARALASACTVLVLAAGGAYAQTTSPAPGTEEAVRAANQQLLEVSRSRDKDAARRIMAEDLSWVDGRGVLRTREELINGTPRTPREVIVDRVNMFGEMAVVTGSARFESGEKVRFLQQWVNRDGAWRIYAHQATALAPAPAEQGGPPPTAGTAGRAPVRASAPNLRSDEERAIWNVQTELQRAYLDGDVATYSRYTADDFFRMEVTGEERRKNEVAQDLRSRADSRRGQLETGDVHIAVSGNTARLVMTTWGTGPGGSSMPPTRVTRVFTNRDGQWQQVAAVFTPLAQQQ